MQACERQIKKDANDVIASKKNAVVVRKVLAAEIASGLFAISENGKEVSILFPAARAFEGASLTDDMKRGLLKLGYAFGSSNGAVVIRNYVPNNYKAEFKTAYDESTARISKVATALMDSTKIQSDRIQMGSMSNSRAPASVKAFPESSTAPFFEVSVIKD